jgi:hypothetical protein
MTEKSFFVIESMIQFTCLTIASAVAPMNGESLAAVVLSASIVLFIGARSGMGADIETMKREFDTAGKVAYVIFVLAAIDGALSMTLTPYILCVYAVVGIFITNMIFNILQ